MLLRQIIWQLSRYSSWTLGRLWRPISFSSKQMAWWIARWTFSTRYWTKQTRTLNSLPINLVKFSRTSSNRRKYWRKTAIQSKFSNHILTGRICMNFKRYFYQVSRWTRSQILSQNTRVEILSLQNLGRSLNFKMIIRLYDSTRDSTIRLPAVILTNRSSKF